MHREAGEVTFPEEILAIAGTLVAVFDPNGRVVHLNRAVEELTGHVSSEVAGRSAWDLFAPPGAEADFQKRFRRCLTAEGPAVHEGEWRTSSGERRRILWRTAALHAGDGTVEAIAAAGMDVTEQRRAETEAARAAKRFRLLVESAIDGVVLLDAGGAIRFASPAAERITGHDATGVVGTDAIELIHPDDRAFAVAAFAGTANRPGAAPPIEVRLRRADDSWAWVEAVANNLLDEPLVAGVVVHLRDVTERHGIEADLLEAFANAPIGMALLGADPTGPGRFLKVNAALAEITGFSEIDLLDWSDPDLTHPEDKQEDLVVFGRLLDGSLTRSRREKRYVRADGSIVWVRMSTSAVPGPDGAVRHFVCQIEDVSERKQVEADLVHRTLHDPLTGLANRSLIADHLEWALARAERSGGDVAVVFVDLDGFKRVNDTFGHEAGDEVLVEAGRRIRSVLRSSDTVGRFGGDEFVVICEGPIGAADVEVVATRIEAVLARPFVLHGGVAEIGASVGTSMGRSGDDPDLLVRRADQAMYVAKADHKSGPRPGTTAALGLRALSPGPKPVSPAARPGRSGRRVS